MQVISTMIADMAVSLLPKLLETGICKDKNTADMSQTLTTLLKPPEAQSSFLALMAQYNGVQPCSTQKFPTY